MYIQLPAVICPYIINPFFSSSSKCSHVAHLGTNCELEMSTRGESLWVFKMPTGLPLWTSNVSSFSSTFNAAMMLSSASRLRAAFPRHRYNNSSGLSARRDQDCSAHAMRFCTNLALKICAGGCCFYRIVGFGHGSEIKSGKLKVKHS